MAVSRSLGRELRAWARPGGIPVSEPPTILGVGGVSVAGLRCWIRSTNNVTESGGAISAVGALGGTEVSFSQATAGKRPTLVTSINGMLAMRFDGVNDSLAGSLGGGGSSVNAYCWLVARATALPGVFAYSSAAWDGAAPVNSPCRMTTTNFTALMVTVSGLDLITGPARDTNVHRFETCFQTGTSAGRYRVDGVSYNGLYGSNQGNNVETFSLGAYQPPESDWGPFDIFEFGYATLVPTTAQRTQMSAYLSTRYAIA